MIASLAMYDRPETAATTDRYWAEIRDRLRAQRIPAPNTLNRETPFLDTWQSPDMVFSQTCGRPYSLILNDTVSLVGTPDYGLPDCPPGYYRSALVVRAKEPRTDPAAFHAARLAYNEKMSQSGWAAAHSFAAEAGFRFENCYATGAHVSSAHAVASDQADIAAIDALSWDLIKRYEGFSLDLRVLAWTKPTPGLPYITAHGQPVNILFDAVCGAIADLDMADRRILRLRELVRIPSETYLSLGTG